MASAFLPSMNPAQLVRPMKGGIFQPSTDTGRSLRGAVTLKTPSAALHAPLRPVSCSMRLVLSAAIAGSADKAREKRMGVFMVFIVARLFLNEPLGKNGRGGEI